MRSVRSTMIDQERHEKCFVMVLLCRLLVAGTAFAKTGTLLVAFGTSMDSARPAIDDIEKGLQESRRNEPAWPSPRHHPQQLGC